MPPAYYPRTREAAFELGLFSVLLGELRETILDARYATAHTNQTADLAPPTLRDIPKPMWHYSRRHPYFAGFENALDTLVRFDSVRPAILVQLYRMLDFYKDGLREALTEEADSNTSVIGQLADCTGDIYSFSRQLLLDEKEKPLLRWHHLGEQLGRCIRAVKYPKCNPSEPGWFAPVIHSIHECQSDTVPLQAALDLACELQSLASSTDLRDKKALLRLQSCPNMSPRTLLAALEHLQHVITRCLALDRPALTLEIYKHQAYIVLYGTELHVGHRLKHVQFRLLLALCEAAPSALSEAELKLKAGCDDSDLKIPISRLRTQLADFAIRAYADRIGDDAAKIARQLIQSSPRGEQKSYKLNMAAGTFAVY